MRLSLQTAFSQQKLHLKSPSEHSGNTREFTNQFTKLAWLETMLLCVDPAERYFLIYQTLVGLLQAVQGKVTPGREMSIPRQVDSGSNPGTKGPAALGESHDLFEPTA